MMNSVVVWNNRNVATLTAAAAASLGSLARSLIVALLAKYCSSELVVLAALEPLADWDSDNDLLGTQ